MKVYKLFDSGVVVQGVRCINPFVEDKMIVIYPTKETGIKTNISYAVSELVNEWYENVSDIVDNLIKQENLRHERRLVEIGKTHYNAK